MLVSFLALPLLANQARTLQDWQHLDQSSQNGASFESQRKQEQTKEAINLAHNIANELNSSYKNGEKFEYPSNPNGLKDRLQRDILASSLNSARPADTPKDRAIKVITSDKQTLCYAPVFSKGEGYIYLDYCSKNTVKPARYDLFGRISYDINGNQLCMTAPSSVTGIEGSSYNSWDYITLRPCVINDANQQWVVRDDAIYTKNKNFRLKAYKYYAYISKNSKDGVDHKLDQSMKSWVNTIASPASINIKTPVFWHFFSYPFGWRPYFLMDNQSTTEYLVDLYYNTQNGHIAQYNSSNGSFKCLASGHQKGQNWNWAKWLKCQDNMSKEDAKYFAWSVDLNNENDYELRDYWGNILRVTKYGSNYGVPYTVTPGYISQDTSKAPTSTFTMANEIRWFKTLNYANMLDELRYCPAGVSGARVKRGLPEDFKLNPGWIGRLWQINITRSSQEPRATAGLCGICMLQSAQMISELMSSSEPRSGGGYLFDTDGETNPFTSLEARYPHITYGLYSVLDHVIGLRYSESDDFIARIVPPLLSTTSMLLPSYTLHPSPMVREDQALELAGNLFSGYPGTIWLAFMYRTAPDGTRQVGHAEPLVMTREGLITLPTNRVLSLQEYQEATRPMHSAQELINYYTSNGQVRLGLLMFVRIGEVDYDNPLDLRISPKNCSGEGEHRRGSKTPIVPSALNQCSGAYGGRCM